MTLVSGSGATRYVNLNNHTPSAPFTSWATAATSIQDAVDAAQAGETVLVANGVYATGARVDEDSVLNRLLVTKPLRIESVNGPFETVIRGAQTTFSDPRVRCARLVEGAVLAGFTLTNGAAPNGGGAWCSSTNVVLTNCFIINNSESGLGGGSYGGTLDHCNIVGNSAGEGGGVYGADLKNCTLFGNRSRAGGGVASCTLSNSTLMSNSVSVLDAGGGAYQSVLYNCTLIGNVAGGNHAVGGGAVTCTLNNCVLNGNYGYGRGGTVSDCTLNNCTLLNNPVDGAAYSTLNNCILYNFGAAGDSTLNYCCTPYLPSSGTGNFTNDPSFVDFAGGDLRLKPGSPCIDAGQNFYAPSAPDLDGNPRISNGRVDVGAYEFVFDAIRVAAAGITNRFDEPPSRFVWSTFSVPGTGISGDSDAFMDSWMRTNGVANITNALDIKAANGLNQLAYWNSTDKRLVTQPTGNNGTLLMARLQNSAGYLISELTVAYTMAASSGTSNEDPIFGHRLYFSQTGTNNSWHPGIIPNQTLITGGVSNNPALKTFTVTNLAWAPGGSLFLV